MVKKTTTIRSHGKKRPRHETTTTTSRDNNNASVNLKGSTTRTFGANSSNDDALEACLAEMESSMISTSATTATPTTATAATKEEAAAAASVVNRTKGAKYSDNNQSNTNDHFGNKLNRGQVEAWNISFLEWAKYHHHHHRSNHHNKKKHKSHSPQQNANYHLLFPNVHVEISRHYKVMGLSTFLMDECKELLGMELRMPSFERWLVDSKLEEASQQQKQQRAGVGVDDDPVLPQHVTVQSAASRRLIDEIVRGCCNASKTAPKKESSSAASTRTTTTKTTTARATKIVSQLCSKTMVAVQELAAERIRYSHQLSSPPLRKGEWIELEYHPPNTTTTTTATPSSFNASSSNDQKMRMEDMEKEVEEDDGESEDHGANDGVSDTHDDHNNRYGNAKAKAEHQNRHGPTSSSSLSSSSSSISSSQGYYSILLHRKHEKPGHALCVKINVTHYHKLAARFVRVHKQIRSGDARNEISLPCQGLSDDDEDDDNAIRIMTASTITQLSHQQQQILQGFHLLLILVLLRYSSLSGGHLLKVWRGGGMQGACHGQVFQVIQDYFCRQSGNNNSTSSNDNNNNNNNNDMITLECFASPLNAHLPHFGSAFPDLDWHFGSIGSFFSASHNNDSRTDGDGDDEGDYYYAKVGGVYQANPPFCPGLMSEMAVTMLRQLELADSSKYHTALTFVVIVPTVNDMDTASASAPSTLASITHDVIKTSGKLKEAAREKDDSGSMVKQFAKPSFVQMVSSRFCRLHMTLPAREHGYIVGAQHVRPTQYKQSNYDTSVIVLQSQKAHNETTGLDVKQLEVDMRKAFASREHEETEQRRKRHNNHTTTMSHRKKVKHFHDDNHPNFRTKPKHIGDT